MAIYIMKNLARLIQRSLPAAWNKSTKSDRAAGRNQDPVAAQTAIASQAIASKLDGNQNLSAGRIDAAIACYREAIDLAPKYAEAHNNLGLAYSAQDRLSEAIDCYQHAISLQADLYQAHFNLGFALSKLGQLPEAQECYLRVIKLLPHHPEALFRLGEIALLDGLYQAAADWLQRAVEARPDYAEAFGLLGVALRKLQREADAELCLRRTLALNPQFGETYCYMELGCIAFRKKKFSEAVGFFRNAFAVDANHAPALNSLGVTYNAMERNVEAETSYRQAIAINPQFDDAHCNLGILLIEQGRMREAESALSAALASNPRHVNALLTLATLIRYDAQDPRFAQLLGLYAQRSGLPRQERIKLNFVMGSAMEHSGDFDQAFAAYAEGNRLVCNDNPFDEGAINRSIQGSKQIFTAEFLAACTVFDKNLPASRDSRVPVFVVGMPRSGSTLVEQILASHRDIVGAGELDIMNELEVLAAPLINTNDPYATLIALRKLGQQYLDRVWQRAPESRFIIDKLPGNFMHLGLLRLMLPNAKFIHSTRNPIDTCLSCYATQFANGHFYSYDLELLGRQYLRYQDLMTYWHAILPQGSILDVSYEATVADLEGMARAMLAYLDLDWDASCLTFFQNRRTVKTASSAQVRRPIYDNSLNRWKPFAHHLQPLIATLQNRSPEAAMTMSPKSMTRFTQTTNWGEETLT